VNVALIPNGIDVELFKPMEWNEGLADALSLIEGKKKRGKTPCNWFLLVNSARKKGLKSLLLGYAQLNKRCPTALLIVGDVRQGEDRQTFDELQLSIPNSQNYPHWLYFAPVISPAYYALMDVFVHRVPAGWDAERLARSDGLRKSRGLRHLSAGPQKCWKDGKNGILVSVNDANILDRKDPGIIRPILRSAVLLAKNARQSIIERFTSEKELEANLNMYRKIGISL